MPTLEELQAALDTSNKALTDANKVIADLKGGIHPSYEARLKNEALDAKKALETVTKERDEFKAFKDDVERKEAEAKGEFAKIVSKMEADKKAEDVKHAAAIKALNEQRIVDKAEAAAIKLGILDGLEKRIGSLVDLSKVTIADDGTIAGLDEAMEALKKDNAGWFKAAGGGDPNINGGRAGASPGGSGGGGDDKRDWGAMDDKTYAAELDKLLGRV